MHQYSTLIGNHLGIEYKFAKDETIFITIKDVVYTKDVVLKLKNSIGVYDEKKPLVRSLMAHYKMDCLCTVFETDDSWSLLLGNQKLAMPSTEGKTHLCLTPYFVKNPKIMETQVSYYEHIHSYKNTVLFFDNYTVPYPGSNYFESEPDSHYRICYLTLQPDLILKFDHLKGVVKSPLRMRAGLATISPFIQNVTLTAFPDTHYQSTNIVLKKQCFRDPDFILHDILDSYPSDTELGIVIETPIMISYLTVEANHQTFQAFAINCNAPKQVLYVPSPYDRYYQYNYPPKHIKWTTLYYDGEEYEQLMPVVACKNIIGYVYKNTFFCLTHPKLTATAKNKNTQYLLDMLSFDIDADPDWKVIQTYRFDSRHVLLCVKHNECLYEMWCMKRDEATKSQTRSIVPSHLVREWGEFVLENAGSTQHDILFMKLMHKLDQHNICYVTKESDSQRRIEYRKDIIFHLEPNALKFINQLRQNDPAEEEEGCVIF